MKKPLLLLALLSLMIAATAPHGFLAVASAEGPGDQAQPPQPQQPPITFRAEVNYVEVDARVLDFQKKLQTDDHSKTTNRVVA